MSQGGTVAKSRDHAACGSARELARPTRQQQDKSDFTMWFMSVVPSDAKLNFAPRVLDLRLQALSQLSFSYSICFEKGLCVLFYF